MRRLALLLLGACGGAPFTEAPSEPLDAASDVQATSDDASDERRLGTVLDAGNDTSSDSTASPDTGNLDASAPDTAPYTRSRTDTLDSWHRTYVISCNPGATRLDAGCTYDALTAFDGETRGTDDSGAPFEACWAHDSNAAIGDGHLTTWIQCE